MENIGLTKKIFDRVSTLCSILSTILIVIMMFSVIIDVIMRWLKTPIYGVYEMQGLLVGMTIYLGLAKAQDRKQHIGAGLLSQYISKRVRSFIAIPIFTFTMMFFGWLTYIYWKRAMDAFVHHEVIAGITQIPVFPLKLVMTVGLGLLTVQLLLDIVKEIRAWLIQEKEPIGQKP